MRSEQIECFQCGRTNGDIKLRVGRGRTWLCKTCDKRFSRQCNRMDVVLPDNLSEQIDRISHDGDSNKTISDSASIETALEDVSGVGTCIIQNIERHGFKNAGDLRAVSQAALEQIDGIGQKMASRIIHHLDATEPTAES